jgi:hypothetical protein
MVMPRSLNENAKIDSRGYKPVTIRL